MNNNQLFLKSIDEILKEDFFIPDYQRGFRWSTTQVLALLNDILKFRADNQDAKKEAFYCLQPIVVAPSDKGWIVIDGQQRLTTIHLILTYLSSFMQHRERKNFGLTYETRSDSDEYLNMPIQDDAYKNIDYYHIYEAYKAIERWFKLKSGNAPLNFITTLLNSDEEGKNVRVIWYEIGEEEFANHIDIYTRLNIGKIPLTNAELVKALFINQLSDINKESNLIKSITLASEWDKIEQTLQQPDFWFFICNNFDKYDTRIEYIFDIIKKKPEGAENYYTFYAFYKDLKENEISVEDEWLKIKQHFLMFEEWFQHRELYHLIGFLITIGKDIEKIIEKYQSNTKSGFKKWLKNEALNQIKLYKLHELNFVDNKNDIKKTLLLFNILSILNNPKSNIRFPFEDYHTQKWDIEHIRSQTGKDISGKDRVEWSIANFEYLSGMKWDAESSDAIKDKLQYQEDTEKDILYDLIKIIDGVDQDNEIFNKVYDALSLLFNYSDQFEDEDGISNLALLDQSTNRMYKNAFFPVKRNYIIQKEKEGVFIPFCTRNVFLKAYSKKLKDVMHWNSKDGDDYFDEIKSTLQHNGSN